MGLNRWLIGAAGIAAAVALVMVGIGRFEADTTRPEPAASARNRSPLVREAWIVAIDEPISRDDPVDSATPATRVADVRKAALAELTTLADVPANAAESALVNAALADRDVAVREEAVHLLSERGGLIAMGTLEQALHDPHRRVREAAIYALVVLGRPEAVSILGSALLTADASMRTRIIDALGEIGGREAARQLEPMLSSEDPVASEAASEWLAELS